MTVRERARYTTWPAAVLLSLGLLGLGAVGAHAATSDPAPCSSTVSDLQHVCTTAEVELNPLEPHI